jgi:hypothetical protein
LFAGQKRRENKFSPKNKKLWPLYLNPSFLKPRKHEMGFRDVKFGRILQKGDSPMVPRTTLSHQNIKLQTCFCANRIAVFFPFAVSASFSHHTHRQNGYSKRGNSRTPTKEKRKEKGTFMDLIYSGRRRKRRRIGRISENLMPETKKSPLVKQKLMVKI